MREAAAVFLAGVAAVAAAAAYAVGFVLQHRAAGEVERAGLGLLWRLLHRPAFLLAGVAQAVGLGLQALALGAGSVSVVQVLLVTGLLFSVPLAALQEHRRATGMELLGAALVVVGVGGFLLALRPGEGAVEVSFLRALPVGGTLLGTAGALVLLARELPRLRPAFLAAGSGLCYGLSTGLFKIVVEGALRDGVRVLASWPPYALLGCGMGGLLLTQSAFQRSGLGSPLAVLTLAEPVAAVLVGVLVLDEPLAASLTARALGAVAAITAAVGVVVLSSSPAARWRGPVDPAAVPRETTVGVSP